MLQCDAERRVVYTNARLHEIMGPTAPGDDADPFATVRAADRELLDEMLTAAIRDGRDRDLEVRLDTEACELRRCRVSIRSLNDEHGDVSGAIVCVDDITESARMRAELETRATFDALTQCLNRAAIMEELGELLAASEPSVWCSSTSTTSSASTTSTDTRLVMPCSSRRRRACAPRCEPVISSAASVVTSSW